MKKKLTLSALVVLSFINLNNAQKVKTETLELTKTVQPILFRAENPIDITLVRTTSSGELASNNLYNADDNIPRYITNNTSTPKYIAVLDYVYKPATSKIEKLGTQTNDLFYKSNIVATLYLLSREKGVFYEENISLQDNTQNNWKDNALFGSLTTVLKVSVNNVEVGNYLTYNSFSPSLVNNIEKTQIERLTIKAYKTIREGMMENESKNRLTFNYLKNDDEFKSPEFDKAYAILKGNINPINKTEILNSIQVWKNEADKLTNLSDKSSKKFKIALFENILNAHYIIDNYETDDIENQLKSLDEKNDVLYFYQGQKNKYSSNKNLEIKEFKYSPLPSNITIPESSKNLFTTNNSSSTNTATAKINSYNYIPNYDYAPILELDNLKYQLLAIKEEKNLSSTNQNTLWDEVVWYTIMSKHKLKELPSKAKSKLDNFKIFTEKLSTEFEAKNFMHLETKKTLKSKKQKNIFRTIINWMISFSTFLVWNLRLVHFLKIRRLKNLKLSTMLQILTQLSKCEN